MSTVDARVATVAVDLDPPLGARRGDGLLQREALGDVRLDLPGSVEIHQFPEVLLVARRIAPDEIAPENTADVAAFQKREIEKNTKDSSYVKDSTATRFDAQGKKIGEDRLHYEYHSRSEKDTQRLLDSIRQYKAYKDSLSIYRSKCDSLMKTKEKSDTKVIKEPVSKMQNIFSHIGVLSCLTILVIVIYIFLYVYERKHS